MMAMAHLRFWHSVSSVWPSKFGPRHNIGPAVCLALFLSMPAMAKTFAVGPDRPLKMPSDAARLAGDGDIVEIDVGRYEGDVAVWTASNLIIRSNGGLAVMDAKGRSAEGKAIWVINGENVTVDGIEFRNAAVPDRNGAGIRAQGRHLTIKNSVFAYNENGILTADDPKSNIAISHSSFIGNGHGDGYSHGLYIGQVNRLSFTHNYVYGTSVGHHLKTRARENEIAYNLLIDGRKGSASYAIDMPGAEYGLVLANIMHQGKNTQNYHFINFEPAMREAALVVVNNTAVNDFDSGHLYRLGGEAQTVIVNNAIAGNIKVEPATLDDYGNVHVAMDEFANANTYDFRLKAHSGAVNAAGPSPSSHGRLLAPEFEYRHPARAALRRADNRLDAGAFEFQAE